MYSFRNYGDPNSTTKDSHGKEAPANGEDYSKSVFEVMESILKEMSGNMSLIVKFFKKLRHVPYFFNHASYDAWYVDNLYRIKAIMFLLILT